MHLKKISILLCLILIALSVNCGQSTLKESNENTEAQEQPENKSVNLPPPLERERGNPKLEYVLIQLIEAEKRGEAEAFARQSAIELRDGSVLVTIRCVPGQAEAVARAAASAGATMVLIYKDLISAFVPITSLEALANETSIYLITVADPGQPQG